MNYEIILRFKHTWPFHRVRFTELKHSELDPGDLFYNSFKMEAFSSRQAQEHYLIHPSFIAKRPKILTELHSSQS